MSHPDPESDTPAEAESLEDRKLREIEHSRQRREVLRGFERSIDSGLGAPPRNPSDLIRDQEAYDYHFSNMKFYSITASSEEYKESWLAARCRPGIQVLDFACGNGENALYAASQGATCIGIDISPEGIENARENADSLGLGDRCQFMVMDGENLEFEDDSFDVVVEYGALHHVDLERALSELVRVMTPNGEAIFVEALRHNPVIHRYRRRTPHLRTEWEVEHILGVESLDVVRKYFDNVDVKFFHLAVLGLVPLRKTRVFKPLLRLLNRFDAFLLSGETIGKYGWIMVVSVAGPKKQANPLNR